jgi:hypothetical protein
MSYQIEYEIKPGYLSARMSGERTMEAIVNGTKEMVGKGGELQQTRLLVDIRDLSGQLQMMESYDIVTREYPKIERTGIQRAAILDRVTSDPKQLAFFETVALNRGFNIRMFTDPKSAMAWLLEGLD